jgi:predicted DNA-binding transcriptional regulator YafY
MRADRLLSILLILQRKEKVTTKELARELEVSSRTILRDLDALSAMGIPVVAERGKNGGWRLLDEYRKTLLALKKEEIASLFLPLPETLLKDLGIDQPFFAARQKLFSHLPSIVEPQAQKLWKRIHIDLEPWKEASQKTEWMEPVLQAVWEERKLRMDYERADGKRHVRTVRPLGLVARGNQWYLVAANEENEIRSYKINRIRSAEILKERFARPEGFEISSYWKQAKARFVANLPRYMVQAELSPQSFQRIRFTGRFVRVLKAEEPDAKGWIPATLQFDTEQEAAETILGFHNQIRVLSPRSLRGKIREMAETVLELYGKD